jgi:hypothetical protein
LPSSSCVGGGRRLPGSTAGEREVMRGVGGSCQRTTGRRCGVEDLGRAAAQAGVWWLLIWGWWRRSIRGGGGVGLQPGEARGVAADSLRVDGARQRPPSGTREGGLLYTACWRLGDTCRTHTWCAGPRPTLSSSSFFFLQSRPVLFHIVLEPDQIL